MVLDENLSTDYFNLENRAKTSLVPLRTKSMAQRAKTGRLNQNFAQIRSIVPRPSDTKFFPLAAESDKVNEYYEELNGKLFKKFKNEIDKTK